jgi:hypothetical protein
VITIKDVMEKCFGMDPSTPVYIEDGEFGNTLAQSIKVEKRVPSGWDPLDTVPEGTTIVVLSMD